MSSYNTLLNKYNTLVAQCQSMQETINTKEVQWSAKAAEYKSVEDNTKELCKLILAKDKSQINLGTEKGSWGSLPVRELIIQAIQSYKKYNKERALALQQILDMAEERQAIIEGLKDQLSFYENNGASTESYEDVVKKKEEAEALTNAIDNTDYETQKNIKNNNIQISISDENETISDMIASTMEEFDSFMPTQSSIPVKDTNGKIALAREKQRQKQVTKKYAAEIDLGRILNDLSKIQKDFINIIGAEGLSEQTDIIKEIREMDDYKNRTQKGLANSVYIAAKELQAMGLITAENVVIPLTGKSNVKIIRFSELGMRLYYLMTGKKPVLSEANYIQTEHDNIHHGYGIKAIYQSIEASGNYKRVNMNCRKDPLIVDPNKNKKITYIPDIIAVHNNNQKCYFEYERGFSNQSTIIEKCNKMVKFTRHLYFITDNKDHAESLLKNLQAWKRESVKRGLKVKVYLSTAKFFQENNFDVTKKWMYILPENDAMPVDSN